MLIGKISSVSPNAVTIVDETDVEISIPLPAEFLQKLNTNYKNWSILHTQGNTLVFPSPLRGESEQDKLTLQGINCSMNKYGKLEILLDENEVQKLDLEQKQPIFNSPQGARFRINLGMHSTNKKTKQILADTVGSPIKVVVLKKKYDSPEYGKGIYYTLISLARS